MTGVRFRQEPSGPCPLDERGFGGGRRAELSDDPGKESGKRRRGAVSVGSARGGRERLRNEGFGTPLDEAVGGGDQSGLPPFLAQLPDAA